MMKILGITGGVGSGKSRVLYDLKTNHGALIIEADKLAHELMEPGKIIYKEIVKVFGQGILSDSEAKSIDRQKLGAVVFADKSKLEQLNNISHPLVKEEIRSLIKEAEKKETGLLVIEAALLIQDGYKDICDEIWYIHVSRGERTKRLMRQRGYTEERCKAMYESQESDEYYIDNSDCVIENEGDYSETAEQINAQLKNFYKNDTID